MKKVRKCAFIALLLLFVLSGCSNQEITKVENTEDDLPPLNADCAYLRIEVLSKDEEGETMNVKVVDFGSYPNVNIGDVQVGTEGMVDCSELLTMGSIKEGAEWVISYKDTGQTDFPITIYSIENTEYFDERTKNQ